MAASEAERGAAEAGKPVLVVGLVQRVRAFSASACSFVISPRASAASIRSIRTSLIASVSFDSLIPSFFATSPRKFEPDVPLPEAATAACGPDDDGEHRRADRQPPSAIRHQSSLLLAAFLPRAGSQTILRAG